MGINLPPLASSLTSFYTNAAAISAFLSTFNQTVLALSSFPELLTWTVGNEISLGSPSGLALSAATGAWSGSVLLGWANMWSLVGTLAAIIHQLDPYHPVGTATPNINLDGACFLRASVEAADARGLRSRVRTCCCCCACLVRAACADALLLRHC